MEILTVSLHKNMQREDLTLSSCQDVARCCIVSTHANITEPWVILIMSRHCSSNQVNATKVK